MRETRPETVAALDAALGATFGTAVLHAFDPKRMLAFAAGGPAAWSVAVTSHPSGVHQFLTYGLSRAVDPRAPFGFELAMRVRATGGVPVWPTLLLRTIARYHLQSGREVKRGQFIDVGAPISQAPVTPEERHLMPTTRMDAILVLGGATLPTPAGPIEIRNVVGLDAAERELLACVHAARFEEALRRNDPDLTVALDSPSLAAAPPFREAMEAASRAEGSDCSAECVPGLAWTDDGHALEVRIPKEASARLHRRLMSRLPFGEGLLVHGTDGGEGTEVLIIPGAEVEVPDQDPTRLTLALPFESTYVRFLEGGDAASWRFTYG